MSWITDPCPDCGGTPKDGSGGRSFVPFEPAPNDIQQEEFDWIDDLTQLSAFVCVECGYVLGVVDPSDPERHRPGISEYRIDRELE